MPRPRSINPRTEKVQFCVTVAEIVTYRKAAEKAQMELTEYARAVMKSAVRNQTTGTPPKPSKPRRRSAEPIIDPVRLDTQTFHQIRMLGINLNQIAHRLNTFDIPAPPELGPLLADIRQVLADSMPKRGPR